MQRLFTQSVEVALTAARLPLGKALQAARR